MQSNFSVTVQRTVSSTPESAWGAFAKPAQLNKWFTTGARQTVRLGGSYTNDDHDSGTFLAVDPPGLLCFTWENAKVPSGGVVTVRIAQISANRSRIRVTQSNMAAATWVPEQREGWSWALDSLKSYLETGRGIRYGEWERQRKAKQEGTSEHRA